MSMRYFKIVDGCSVTDIALADGGYNYYLFARPGGSCVIMRENLAQDEYRFYPISNPSQSESFIDSEWAARTSKTYVRTSAIKAL